MCMWGINFLRKWNFFISKSKFVMVFERVLSCESVVIVEILLVVRIF